MKSGNPATGLGTLWHPYCPGFVVDIVQAEPYQHEMNHPRLRPDCERLVALIEGHQNHRQSRSESERQWQGMMARLPLVEGYDDIDSGRVSGRKCS